MTKRLISALLTVMMLLSMVTVNAYADETEQIAYESTVLFTDSTEGETSEDNSGTEVNTEGESSSSEESSEVSEESSQPSESSEVSEDSSENSESSEENSGETSDSEVELIPLEAPVVTASNVAKSGKVKLTWAAVEGAKEYVVYRAESQDGEYVKKFTTTNTSYTNTSAVAGNTYYYKVEAVSETPEQNSISLVVSRTCNLQRPVVTVTNVQKTGKIKLTWPSVSGAVKYKVYRSSTKDGTYKLLKTITGTQFTNVSIEPESRYYYKVMAVAQDTAANSAYSVAVGRTCDLAQPVIKAIANAKGKPYVTWEAVPGAVKYKIYRSNSENGVFKQIYTVTKTSFTNTSATAGKTYYYKVRAVAKNTYANSVLSAADECIAPKSSFNNLYSSFSTTIYNLENLNYAVACSYVDGTILAPGDEFSLNEVVGPRWSSRGFGEAPVIEGGELTTGVGGGLCQIATTLFNAALYANFDITDREQHSLTSSYIDIGRDAMMYKDSSDFRFINTSDYYIKISAKATDGRVSIKFYTRENVESPRDDVSLKVFKTGTREYFLVRRYKGEPNYYTKTYYD